MINSVTSVPINKIENDFLKENQVELIIQREDLIHPFISGNKWRKLKYNVEKFRKGNFESLVTFGGTSSNHIAATAAAGKKFDIPCVGIIRGDDKRALSSTLEFAKKQGMKLEFISRSDYKNKNSESFLKELSVHYPNSYLLPEGGSNIEAIQGCAEITAVHSAFDTVICACGTGTTLSGIISSLKPHQNAIGIPVLKNANFLNIAIQQQLNSINCNNTNWKLELNYHLGGYAKYHEGLIAFIQDFYTQTEIQLDPLYTGKMLFALYDLIAKKSISNCSVLAIHTGGLQGVIDYEKRYNLNLFSKINP